MNKSFGPWSTAINTGATQELNTFWKRRLAMLPTLNRAPSAITRRGLLLLAILGFIAIAVPTIKWAVRRDQIENARQSPTGAPSGIQIENTGAAEAQVGHEPEISAVPGIPNEMQKATLAPYRVEPPDVLSVELVGAVRHASDAIRAGDELTIRAANLLPVDPKGDRTENEFKTINGAYQVQNDGSVDLGPLYGSTVIGGLDIKAAKTALDNHFRKEVGLADPKVAISFADVSSKNVIARDHLVRPDGTISLGIYGSVSVTGMTLDEVKAAVETHLSKHIQQPEVQVDVVAYNSKVIYVITDGENNLEQVVRVPYSGNETVLDAMSHVSEVAARNNIWVARPVRNGNENVQKLRVDWRAITEDAITATNYQLLPGDRIYVKRGGSR
jgi:polysaccharide export outer membrane protein